MELKRSRRRGKSTLTPSNSTVLQPVVLNGPPATSLASSPSAASAWQHDTRRSEQDSHPNQNAWQQPGSASAAQPTDRSAAQQFGERTKQIAAGAARGFRSAVDTQNKETGPAKLLGWLPLVLAGLSLLAVGAMFFPSARIIYRNESTDEPFKIPDGSASFYGNSQGHIGIYLVILLVITIVLAALAFATRRLWARIGAAVAGLAAGILGLIAGFGAASGNKLDFSGAIRSHFEDALPSLFHRYSDYFGDYDADDIREEIDDLISDSSVWRLIDIKLGFGAIILGILAILIVIVALLVAVPPRKVNDLAASAAAANQESTGKQQAWDQPAQQTWGQPAQPENPYGQQQNPYGQTPTAQQPEHPYGQQQNPYGRPQPGQDPYGQPQPGQDPYGRNQE